METKKSKKRILVLSAKTGGGHRAAALAIIAELEKYPNLEIIHHDFIETAPRPIRDIPKMYSTITKVKSAYGTIFKLTEGSRKAQFTIDTIAKRYKKLIGRTLDHYHPDLILSCHFGANALLYGMQQRGQKIPFITVVTDLVTGHPMWFDSRADKIIVPSNEAYRRGRDFGVPAEKLKIIGQPVAAEFAKAMGTKPELKTKLGWPSDVPTVLVMAGGDGMGKINSLSRRVDKLKTPAHLAIVAGRNKNLYANLKNRNFRSPVTIYQFRDDVPELMQAADVLLTKAGPGTIVEAIVSRLPIVLFDFLPGQEEGNIHYVVEHRAGLWASTNTLATRATEAILDGYAQIGGPNYEKVREQHLHAASEIAEFAANFRPKS